MTDAGLSGFPTRIDINVSDATYYTDTERINSKTRRYEEIWLAFPKVDPATPGSSESEGESEKNSLPFFSFTRIVTH